MTRLKDVYLPKLYCAFRDTLVEGGWEVITSDDRDTFLRILSPCGRIRIVLQYSTAMLDVFPCGTWTIKLNLDPDLYCFDTQVRELTEDTSTFMHELKRMYEVAEVYKANFSEGKAFYD